jgi:hypothetical protein
MAIIGGELAISLREGRKLLLSKQKTTECLPAAGFLRNKTTLQDFDNSPGGVKLPVLVAARSKAWVCGRSLTGIVGSSTSGGMDVCFL